MTSVRARLPQLGRSSKARSASSLDASKWLTWRLEDCQGEGCNKTPRIYVTTYDLVTVLSREIPLFHKNPGWWTIMIWPDSFTVLEKYMVNRPIYFDLRVSIFCRTPTLNQIGFRPRVLCCFPQKWKTIQYTPLKFNMQTKSPRNNIYVHIYI